MSLNLRNFFPIDSGPRSIDGESGSELESEENLDGASRRVSRSIRPG